jgi:hypothetical protein
MYAGDEDQLKISLVFSVYRRGYFVDDPTHGQNDLRRHFRIKNDVPTCLCIWSEGMATSN